MTQTLKDKISESENKHFQAGWQAGLDFMKNREKKINNSVSGKEDVKLPEVGKKYEDLRSGERLTVRELLCFWLNNKDDFVELPEDTKEERFARVKDLMGKGQIFLPKEPDIIKDEIPKSDMADALAYVLNSKPKSIWKDVSELPSGQAYDCYLQTRTGNIMPVLFANGEVFVPLRLQIGDGAVRNIRRHIYDGEKLCTLTDYINNTEERLRKLEGK